MIIFFKLIKMATLDQYYRNAERNAIRTCLDNFSKFNQLPETYKDWLVTQLEIGCNNTTYEKAIQRNITMIWDEPRYVEQYSNIGYHLKINLDVNSSVNVDKPDYERNYLAGMVVAATMKKYLQDLFIGDIDEFAISNAIRYVPSLDPKLVAAMSAQELNPYTSRVDLEKIRLRENQTIDKKFTKMYQCSVCGTRRATPKTVQSCALDEDNTLFLECDECGHNWRIY